MNLSIVQLVSLVYRYNEYLKTGIIPKEYLESTAFERCETVGYILLRNYVTRPGLDGEIAAANPIRWFKLLEKEGCLKLSLHYRLFDPPAFKNDKLPQPIKGELFIEAIYKGYSHFWANRWFNNPVNKDSWDVRYYLVYRFEDTINEKADLPQAKKQLYNMLQKCISFATNNDLLSFANLFSFAFNIIDDPSPQSVFIKKDLIDDEACPLATRQVLYSMLISFVFPDEEIWKTDLKKQEDISVTNALAEEFFAVMINSLLASVNSTT